VGVGWSELGRGKYSAGVLVDLWASAGTAVSVGIVLARQALRVGNVRRRPDDCGRGFSAVVDGGRCAEMATAGYVGGCQDLRDLGVEGQAMTQADSVICTLVLTGVHRCDISPILRNTRWDNWYENASQLNDDEDGEAIVSLPIASLQEAQEVLQLTSAVSCSMGRTLCFIARGTSTAHINLCDSGKGWQELSGAFY
jgi:hypothetical protein